MTTYTYSDVLDVVYEELEMHFKEDKISTRAVVFEDIVIEKAFEAAYEELVCRHTAGDEDSLKVHELNCKILMVNTFLAMLASFAMDNMTPEEFTAMTSKPMEFASLFRGSMHASWRIGITCEHECSEVGPATSAQ